MDSLPAPRVNATSFVALALVINRVRDGPTFVFHYPPQVNAARTGDSDIGSDTSGPFSTRGISNQDDLLLERLSGPFDGSSARTREDPGAADEGRHNMPWDRVAGFPTKDLASILTPGRPYHKRLFQLSLDPLCCVSYPIHVSENGKWKKKKAHKPKSKPPRSGAGVGVGGRQSVLKGSGHEPHSEDGRGGNLDGGAAEAQDGCRRAHQLLYGKDNSTPTPANSKQVDEASEDKPSSMNMFNLVFILNPKKHEANELVETLYVNIIKKVNKALKYSQEHSDFVWKESKRILTMKEKGREEGRKLTSLWKDIITASSLASSIQEIYNSVSQNKIATLHLDTAGGTLTPSVQIPIPFSVADLPPVGQDEPHRRGLWLTTANTFVEEDALNEPSFLDKNFALLLMDEEKNIVSELQAGLQPSAQSMLEFVRLSKPTVSFHKVGQNSSITLGQVRRFAQHFIFWRRAIAIPPLHARDVYILSPNCDMARLPSACVQWQRSFSHVPSLPNLLAELSYAPRSFKSFTPTKAHQPLYLHMLAWLMRGGWVTQLRTFAYVVVWPEIVYEVEYQVEAEEIRKAAVEMATEYHSPARPSGPNLSSPLPSSDIYSWHGRQSADRGYDDRRAGSDAVPHVPSLTEQTAEQARLERIADKAKREAAERATAHARKVVPKATNHPSLNRAPHLAGVEPHIIVDARKTAGKESLYLFAIARRLDDDKAAAAWPRFLRYFNGQCALERIALQEDLKRKEAWALLSAMSEYLLCVRHW